MKPWFRQIANSEQNFAGHQHDLLSKYPYAIFSEIVNQVVKIDFLLAFVYCFYSSLYCGWNPGHHYKFAQFGYTFEQFIGEHSWASCMHIFGKLNVVSQVFLRVKKSLWGHCSPKMDKPKPKHLLWLLMYLKLYLPYDVMSMMLGTSKTTFQCYV